MITCREKSTLEQKCEVMVGRITRQVSSREPIDYYQKQCSTQVTTLSHRQRSIEEVDPLDPTITARVEDIDAGFFTPPDRTPPLDLTQVHSLAN
jgi:hypothetical protein